MGLAFSIIAALTGTVGAIAGLRAVFLCRRNARLLRGSLGKDAEYRAAYEEIRG